MAPPSGFVEPEHQARGTPPAAIPWADVRISQLHHVGVELRPGSRGLRRRVSRVVESQVHASRGIRCNGHRYQGLEVGVEDMSYEGRLVERVAAGAFHVNHVADDRACAERPHPNRPGGDIDAQPGGRAIVAWPIHGRQGIDQAGAELESSRLRARVIEPSPARAVRLADDRRLHPHPRAHDPLRSNDGGIRAV